MASRLEHQAGSYPIVLPNKMLTLFAHRLACQIGTIGDNHPHRITASMGINAFEYGSGHD